MDAQEWARKILQEHRKKKMDIKNGRRKSFDIEFVKVTEDNIQEVAEWCGGVIGGEGKDRYIQIIDKNAINIHQTRAFFDDLVVHSLDTKSYKRFARKSFNKTFEEVVASGDNLTETEKEVDKNAEEARRELDRSAESGQFVTHEEALANPSTTVHETVDIPADAGLGEKE